MTNQQLEEVVRNQAGQLLSAENPFERAEIAAFILLNDEVASLVLMLLAEAVIPLLADTQILQ